MYLMIDNYDSFTYNLVQLFGILGVEMEVHRNDAIGVRDVAHLGARAIVISPGPCSPDESGISTAVVETYLGIIPILGVCLGHQAIAQALGGRIVPAKNLVHGKTSKIQHDGTGLFAGIEPSFEATRYHSLVADPCCLPKALQVSAETEDGEIMGVRHQDSLCVGVQFHPESVLTRQGPGIVRNFIKLVDERWERGETRER